MNARLLSVLLLVAAFLAAGCRTMSSAAPVPDPDAPPDLPFMKRLDPAHLHFTRSQVQVGDVAPDFTLPRIDRSGDVTLSSLRGRPVVLVFGSFT